MAALKPGLTAIALRQHARHRRPRDARLEQAIGRIDKLGGLTPRGIRTYLKLNKPIYRPTAAYGHFGRTPEGDFFPWERLDLVEELKAAIGLEALAVEA